MPQPHAVRHDRVSHCDNLLHHFGSRPYRSDGTWLLDDNHKQLVFLAREVHQESVENVVKRLYNDPQKTLQQAISDCPILAKTTEGGRPVDQPEMKDITCSEAKAMYQSRDPYRAYRMTFDKSGENGVLDLREEIRVEDINDIAAKMSAMLSGETLKANCPKVAEDHEFKYKTLPNDEAHIVFVEENGKKITRFTKENINKLCKKAIAENHDPIMLFGEGNTVKAVMTEKECEQIANIDKLATQISAFPERENNSGKLSHSSAFFGTKVAAIACAALVFSSAMMELNT